MEVPRPHPHLACYTFDLPAVTLIGRENTARQSLSFVTIQKRVAGLFYQQPFRCRSGGTKTLEQSYTAENNDRQNFSVFEGSLVDLCLPL